MAPVAVVVSELVFVSASLVAACAVYVLAAINKVATAVAVYKVLIFFFMLIPPNPSHIPLKLVPH